MLQHPRPGPGPWLYWLVPAIAVVLSGAVIVLDVNQTLFLGINQVSRYTGDALWECVTIFGNGFVVAGLILPLVGRRPEMIASALMAAVLTAVAVKGLKAWVHAPRPPAVLPAHLLHVIGPTYMGGSFPSGHSATAFVFAGLVSLTFNRPWISAAVLAPAAAVALSRVVVGVHWPADVLAGAAVGWLCAAGAVVLARRRRQAARAQPWLGVPLYLAALALWWPGATDYAAARPLQYLVAAIALVATIDFVRRRLRATRESAASPSCRGRWD